MADERFNENGENNGFNEKQTGEWHSGYNYQNTSRPNNYGQYSYNPYGKNGYQNGGYNNAQNFHQDNQQEYRWSFEDYEAAGRKRQNGVNRQKSRGGAGVIIGTIFAVFFLIGVFCLAGYGIYTLWTNEGVVEQPAFEQAQSAVEGASSVPELTIKDHPVDDGEAAASGGKLTTVEIAKKVRPSVVGIAQYSASDTFSPSGEGSGIILNSEGYIVTNAHVVQGSAGINVELDSGETYSAKLIGLDTKTDLAIIKIEASNLVAAEFGNSETMQVGETVVAIGNPGGSTLAGSVTQGIISAVDRTIKSDGYSNKFLQTDAAINPGNSGGALVNEYGQVVGINSAKIAAVEYEGIGFAIPINEAKPIIDDIIANGYVTGRCKIGISGFEVNEAISQINAIPKGIYIKYIDPVSDIAGKNVTAGDIMIAIDGVTIETFDDVSNFLKDKKPGDTVKIRLYRSARGIADSGKTFEVDVVLMEDRVNS